MSQFSASFSLTLRVRVADDPDSFADLTRAIANAGGLVDAIDLVRIERGSKIRDVTVLAADASRADVIAEACADVPRVELERISDRTFLLHLGGKIHTSANVPVKTRDDLYMGIHAWRCPGLPGDCGRT